MAVYRFSVTPAKVRFTSNKNEGIAMRRFKPGFLVILLSICSSVLGQTPSPLPSPPFSQCPRIGFNTACAILIVFDQDGSLRVATDPSQGPFDGIEDTLIGVQSNSKKTIYSIRLRSPDTPLFAFDGDGLCTFLPPCFGPTGYEGPGVTFSDFSSALSGTVNFTTGIPPNGKAYFALEGAIRTQCPALNVSPLKQASAPWGTDNYDHLFKTRIFSSIASVSPTGNMELVTFGTGAAQPDSPLSTSYLITLDPASNNLNGLQAAINALNVGLSASVVPTGSGFALSITAPSSVRAIELRATAGDATTNMLTRISEKGCYLTSAAMLVNYATQGAIRTNPRDLNNFLNDDPRGYSDGNVVGPEVSAYVARNNLSLPFKPVAHRDDFTLDQYLCNGLPVILEVTIQQTGKSHFVVATGQTITADGIPTYSINDPGFPNTTLAAYSFTYKSMRLFGGFTPNSAGFYVLAHSPVELLVTDPSGNRTGVNPVAGTRFEEILESAYYAESIEDDIDPSTSEPTPEVKTFADPMPQSGKYVVDVFGTGEGPYTLDFLGYDAGGNPSTVTVTGTASPGMMIRYQVLYSTQRGSQIQVSQVPVDTVPPVTVANASPAPNANGWNNTNVTLGFSATDNEPGGSGVKEVHVSLSGAQTGAFVIPGSTASVTVSLEGTTTASYFSVDNAGNVETAHTLTVRIDKTPPAISGMPASGCTLWPPDGKLVQVATVSAIDSLSGLAAFNLAGSSSEPAEPGESDVVITGGALQPQDVQLRAQRLGTGPGRVYTIIATATDQAGNTTTRTASCTVPHDQGL